MGSGPDKGLAAKRRERGKEAECKRRSTVRVRLNSREVREEGKKDKGEPGTVSEEESAWGAEE